MTADIDGIWRLDFYGADGWETVGTLTFWDGKVSGGSITHYTLGSFSREGDSVTLDTVVHFYGDHKPFFGSRAQRVQIHIIGKLNGETIEGRETSSGILSFPSLIGPLGEDTVEGRETSGGGSGFSYPVKLTRHASLEW